MNTSSLFTPQMLVFNFLPSLTLHASWKVTFGIPLADTQGQATSSAWHRHCSQLILHQLDLFDRPVLDDGHPATTLALLTPDVLARLSLGLGAVVLAPQLRCVIDGRSVRELRALLGESMLDFACRRGQSKAVPDWCAGLANTTDSWHDRISAVGRSALSVAWCEAGPALSLRAGLKLDKKPVLDLPLEPSVMLADALDVLTQVEAL